MRGLHRFRTVFDHFWIHSRGIFESCMHMHQMVRAGVCIFFHVMKKMSFAILIGIHSLSDLCANSSHVSFRWNTHEMELKTRFYAGASCIQSTLESEDGAAEERGIEFKGLYSLFDYAVNLVFLFSWLSDRAVVQNKCTHFLRSHFLWKCVHYIIMLPANMGHLKSLCCRIEFFSICASLK